MASNSAPEDDRTEPAGQTIVALPRAKSGTDACPVIGLGASAGGFSALRAFFEAMPPRSGFAFVVVMHLSSEHESALAAVLQRSTAMTVVQAQHGQVLQPDHVYVIPPGKNISLAEGQIHLADFPSQLGRRATVDLFFRSLAEERGARGVGIVLSGADGDGAGGLKRIKECGGLTIAQDPGDAEHSSMPRTAIATGMVDLVLRAGEMPARIVRYLEFNRPFSADIGEETAATFGDAEAGLMPEPVLQQVLTVLRERTGRDFSYYKRATVLRRVARRLRVNGMADLGAYLAFLQVDEREPALLLRDLLLSVTNFFRDPQAFQALERRVPSLFEGKGPSDVVRVWVAACATGEEAYSVAMLLCEHARRLPSPPRIQIFATDLDAAAIQDCREGLYPETIAGDVSPERLERFFSKEPRGYRIRRDLRELVLFAVHDLLADSPFLRLDLVTCRNLLIYLRRPAQTKLLEIFHFVLRPRGRLLLGAAESLDDSSPLFAALDKTCRLYESRPVVHARVPVLPATCFPRRAGETSPGAAPLARADGAAHSPWRELHWKFIEWLGSPSVLVDREHQIVHLSAQAGKFLRFGSGEPSRDLLQAVDPALRVELRSALFRAAKTGVSTSTRGVTLQMSGGAEVVSVRVAAARDVAPDLFLVSFLSETGAPPVAGPLEAEQVSQELEQQLEAMKADIREGVERYETSTEELKASNEELQATNEELETGREELQSISEELSAVNQELKGNVEELGRANSDLHNLMGATAIATIFLDRDLCITRYTPAAVSLFRLIPGDVGRPLTDLTHGLDYPGLAGDAARVLAELAPSEAEVNDRGGRRTFLARILPYRTIEDRVAGIVLTFVDITARRHAEDALRTSEARLRQVLALAPAGIYTCDTAGRITFHTPYAARLWGREPGPDETDELFRGLLAMQKPDGTAIPADQSPMARAALGGESARDIEVTLVQPSGRRLVVSANVDPILGPAGERLGAINIFQDITERKAVEASLRQEMAERRRAQEARETIMRQLLAAQEDERSRISRGLHDEVGQNVTALQLGLKNLGASTPGVADLRQLAEKVGRDLHHLALELRPTALDDLGLEGALSNYAEDWEQRTGIAIEIHTVGLDGRRFPGSIETTLYRIVREALNNIARHAQAKHVSLILERREAEAVAVVEDDGKGFDNAAGARPGETPGLGLVGMRERAALVGGELTIESQPGRGTAIFVRLPLGRQE